MGTPTSPEDETVVDAARWLADQAEPPRAAVPELKRRFGLSAVQACEAIKLTEQYRRAND